MISFSGIDCSGKSTQINLLCKELEKNDIKYRVIWSRGGYTPGINFLKKIIRRNSCEMTNKEKINYSENVNKSSFKRKLLFTVGLIDLCFYYSVVLRMKEAFGTTIICDRYIWDTYIDYKMKYPDINFENGFWWNLTLKTMLKPTPSFVLFIPAEESMRRSDLKDEPFPEPVEVRERRINFYLDEVKNNRWNCVIDAMKSIDEVYEEIEEHLNNAKS